MTVEMSFASTKGSYTFDKDEMPLLSRRIDFRRTEQGYGTRRIVCELAGFIDRNSHNDVMLEYEKLIKVVKCNDAEFVYTSSSENGVVQEIIHKRVYIDAYTDPADWKEYQGEYVINFHYFEPADYSTADLGITASYQTTDTLYTFDPPPLWSSGIKPNRTSWRAPTKTPSGQKISSEATITLQGQLTADPNQTLKGKIDALEHAFLLDGTLNYGGWSNVVRVDDVQIPSTFPHDFCDYSIILKYDLEQIYHFQSKRSFSRIHYYPKIKEYPFCGTRRVQLFFPSSQIVRYYIHIQAASVSACRGLLANEAALLVYPGGIEMEGGTDDWDDTEASVTVAFTKWYADWILNNLGGT